LELDYQLGEDIKEKLIPRAIDWFTGEARQYEGLGGEDMEADFEDDDDDDEDDLSDDDREEEDEESDDEVCGPLSLIAVAKLTDSRVTVQNQSTKRLNASRVKLTAYWHIRVSSALLALCIKMVELLWEYGWI
jgi:hypothetical protein